MKHTKFTSLLLVLAMTLSLFVLCVTPAAAEAASDVWNGKSAAFEKGVGTDADPFLIETPQQLAFLSEVVNKPVEYLITDEGIVNSKFVVSGTKFTANGKGTGEANSTSYAVVKVSNVNYLFNYEKGLAYKLSGSLSNRMYVYLYTIGGEIYASVGNGSNKAGSALYSYSADTLEWAALEGVTLGKTGNNFHLVGGSVAYNAADPTTYDNSTGRNDGYTATYTDETGTVRTVMLSGDFFSLSISNVPYNTMSYGGQDYAWLSDGVNMTHASYSYTQDANGVCTVTFGETVTMSGAYNVASYKLANDLTLNASSADWSTWETTAPAKKFTPIGQASGTQFFGTFDGAGHTIKGLYISSSGDVGLFGYLQGAEIKNLRIEESTIISTGNKLAGAVCASIHDSTIRNCHVTDTLVKCASNSAGGIAGATCRNTSAWVYIDGCTFDGTVKAKNAGGVVGYLSTHSAHLKVTGTTVRGTVTGTALAAGFVANTQVNSVMVFENCATYAAVTASTGVAGGILAKAEYSSSSGYADFINVISAGDVTGATYAGGLMGARTIYTANNSSIARGVYKLYNFISLGTVKTTGTDATTCAAGGVYGYGIINGETRFVNSLIFATVEGVTKGSVVGLVATAVTGQSIWTTNDAYVLDSAVAGSGSVEGVSFATLTEEQRKGTALVSVDDPETEENEERTLMAALSENVTDQNSYCSWYQLQDRPGFYQEYVDAQNLKPYAASVTLGDALAINLYVAKSELADINYVATSSANVTTSEVELNGVTYLCVTLTEIAAADIAKDLTVTFRSVNAAGNETADAFTVTYSVADYIDRMSGKGNDKLDALLAALSDYAKAAAGEDVDVDEAYAALTLTPVTNVDNTYVKAIALDLTDSIRPIIKVADGVAEVTVAIYGETYTYAVVDGEVIIDCLTATSLNNEMVLSFVDADDKVLGTTRYAVANYIKSVETLDLAKALAVYMQAARAYNGLD